MYQTSQRRSQEMGAMKAPEWSVLTLESPESRRSGAGGQHRNTTAVGPVIPASTAVARVSRSENRRASAAAASAKNIPGGSGLTKLGS